MSLYLVSQAAHNVQILLLAPRCLQESFESIKRDLPCPQHLGTHSVLKINLCLLYSPLCKLFCSLIKPNIV